MQKRIETILSQNKYRTYSKLNIPEQFNFIPLEVGHAQLWADFSWDTCADRLTIHYVFSGKGTLEKDGKIYHLSRGDAFAINHAEPFRYTADHDDPWHYYWIHFKSPKFAKKLKKLESPVFRTNNESAFLDSVARGECGALTSEFIISKLYLLHDDIFAGKHAVSFDLAMEVAICINDNYSINLTLEQLASQFSVSRNYLSILFKEKYGISVKQYILRVKFGKAKEFLKQGYSVKEAAYLCGYSDQLSFSKMYKKIYGVTPKSVYTCLK